MRFIVASIACLLVLAPIGSLAAQRDTLGAIEGTIRERSSFRSVLAARVAVRRMEPDTTVMATATPDVRGRFRVDSLPPGRYRARVVSPALDSVHVEAPATELTITPGRVVLADFTLPPGAALRDAVCRGDRHVEGRGAVAGRAIDADAGDRPLAGAVLRAIWMEFSVDRAARRSVATRRVVEVKADQAGEYRICGVPTEMLFTLQLRSRGRASPVLQLMIGEDEGVIARDISLSAQTAPTIDALDSAAIVASKSHREERADELRMVGASELSGTVRGLSGEPFVGAQVHVRHARSSTVTDQAGHFTLGELPAGTQMLVVRHPGYTPAELPVELRPGKRADRAVLLVRPLTLDAIQSTDLEEFDAMRRTNPYGQFLTREQIDKKKSAVETVDLFDDLLGFTALGSGPSARVISNVALASHRQCSEASVVVQGGQGRRINDVTPSQIAGIEAYADAAFVPGRFAGQADCGVVVIWLRKIVHPTPPAATGLRANGYP
jgi:hypothetical protein